MVVYISIFGLNIQKQAKRGVVVMKFQPEFLAENGLFYGDNLYIIQALKESGYKEKFSMIYFDGPFNSGWVFSAFNKELNEYIIDPWSEAATIHNFYHSDDYLSNYRQRIEAARELLNEKGIFVFHTSQKEGHYLKVILDEVFGREHFLGEVIWKFADAPVYKQSQFGLNHETIFFYAKTDNHFKKQDGCYSSVWDDVASYEQLGQEDTFYATQKPEKLMERIVQMTTDEQALIGDFYCGSGTLPFVAETMNRRWIASDHSRLAVQTTVSRLETLGVEVNVHQLVEDFQENYLRGNEYRKKSTIPFSLAELQGLKRVCGDVPVTVSAYEYTPEIDLADSHNVAFQLIMPGFTEVANETVVSRPVPSITEEGCRLDVPEPLHWIRYHILHGQLDKDGYQFNPELLQQRVKDLYRKLNNDWLTAVKEFDDYYLCIDIFGYFYKLSK